jgi:hypothetical protein
MRDLRLGFADPMMCALTLSAVLFCACRLLAAPPSPTDRVLFREAVEAGRGAHRDQQSYIFSEIAEAQAKRGYYDDALETGRLVESFPDQVFVKIVEIRAQNGDISGAKGVVDSAPVAEWKARAKQSIAVVEAESGKLDAALATSRDLPEGNKVPVLQAIGMYQAKAGDVASALKTVSLLKPGGGDDILFEIVDLLRKRGEEKRAQETAHRMQDQDMALMARDPLGWKKQHPESQSNADPCQVAVTKAKAGDYPEAIKIIQSKSCECNGDEYVYIYAHDPANAERAARACSNPGDVSYRMAELAKISAGQGEVAQALKFAGFIRVSGASYEEGYLAPALREIAEAWVTKDGPDQALNWARSLPDAYQKSLAILGVAESSQNAK